MMRMRLTFGLDSTALVQEFIPARDAHIVRVEVLNGKYLYAIKVHITGETFDLCPADICRTSSGVDLNRAACAIDAPKSGITVEGVYAWADVIDDVERIMEASGIDIGGVEYLVDDREWATVLLRYECAFKLCGGWEECDRFDPFVKLVDWLEAEGEVSVSRNGGLF